VRYGTHVPVQTLLDYLKGGETVDDLLNKFPPRAGRRVAGGSSRSNQTRWKRPFGTSCWSWSKSLRLSVSTGRPRFSAVR